MIERVSGKLPIQGPGPEVREASGEGFGAMLRQECARADVRKSGVLKSPPV